MIDKRDTNIFSVCVYFKKEKSFNAGGRRCCLSVSRIAVEILCVKLAEQSPFCIEK